MVDLATKLAIDYVQLQNRARIRSYEFYKAEPFLPRDHPSSFYTF